MPAMGFEERLRRMCDRARQIDEAAGKGMSDSEKQQCLEEQREEVEALQSIFDSDFEPIWPASSSSSPSSPSSASAPQETAASNFTTSPYNCFMIDIRITLARLCAQLDATWQQQSGLVVLYTWAAWLGEETLGCLGIGQDLRLTGGEGWGGSAGGGEGERKGEASAAGAAALSCLCQDAPVGGAAVGNAAAFGVTPVASEPAGYCRAVYEGMSLQDDLALLKRWSKEMDDRVFRASLHAAFAEAHVAEGNLQALKCPDTKCRAPLSYGRCIAGHCLLPALLHPQSPLSPLFPGPIDFLRTLLPAPLFSRWEQLSLPRSPDAMPVIAFCPRCTHSPLFPPLPPHPPVTNWTDILRTLLPQPLFSRWEQLTLQRSLDAMPDIAFCPRCSQPAVEDPSDHHALCPGCFFSFCGVCREGFHRGRSCITPELALKLMKLRKQERALAEEELRKHKDLEQQVLSLKLVEESSVQCPMCSTAISKSEGCNKMVCPTCNTFFCYRCHERIDGYDHFTEGKCVLFEAAEIEQWEMQMAAMAEAQRHNQRAAPPLGADGRPLLARRCPNCRQFNHKVSIHSRSRLPLRLRPRAVAAGRLRSSPSPHCLSSPSPWDGFSPSACRRGFDRVSSTARLLLPSATYPLPSASYPLPSPAHYLPLTSALSSSFTSFVPPALTAALSTSHSPLSPALPSPDSSASPFPASAASPAGNLPRTVHSRRELHQLHHGRRLYLRFVRRVPADLQLRARRRLQVAHVAARVQHVPQQAAKAGKDGCVCSPSKGKCVPFCNEKDGFKCANSDSGEGYCRAGLCYDICAIATKSAYALLVRANRSVNYPMPREENVSMDVTVEGRADAGSPVAASIPDPLTSRAIRLVYKDEQGVFRMDPEAVSALRRLRGPLGLLGRSSGFTVGPTHRPCTKGLWIWSSPVKVTAPDGSSYHLLLLDSEGIDAYDQTVRRLNGQGGGGDEAPAVHQGPVDLELASQSHGSGRVLVPPAAAGLRGHRRGTYSTQIFSLAVLLSSLFVYNQMGGIDESSLDRLSMVTEMTKHIQVRANSASAAGTGGGAGGAAGSSSVTQELGLFSPVFFWLLRVSFCGRAGDHPRDYLLFFLHSSLDLHSHCIASSPLSRTPLPSPQDFYFDLTEDGQMITPRDCLLSFPLSPAIHTPSLLPSSPPSPQDFYFDLTEDGRVITPRDYLETALQSMAEGSESARAKNQIRESIRSLFPDRDCFALVRPISNERLLQKLDHLPVSFEMEQLRPEFKQRFDAFTQAVFAVARPKRMDQLRPEFKQGLDSFTQAVFARARPKRVGGTVMTGPMLAGLTQAYIQALITGLFPPFSTPGWAALQAAEAAFREEAVGEGQARHKYEEKLREEAGKRFEQNVLKRVAAEAEVRCKRYLDALEAKDVLKRVAAEAEVRCKRYLDALEAKVKGLARGPPRAATADLVRALIAELAAYESSMSGAAKWRCLSAFLVASETAALWNVSRSAEKEVAEAKQQASSALKDKQAAEARALAEAAAAAREAAAAEDWKKRVASVEGQLADANRLIGEGREERERMRKEMEEGRRRADERERECVELRKELERVREGGEKEVRRVSGEAERVKGQLEEAKRRVGEEQGEKVKWRGMYEKEVGEGKREVEKVVGERDGLRGEVERERQRRQAEVAAIQKEKVELEKQLRAEASKAAAEASELKIKLESQAARLAATEKALVETKARERQAEESMREASRTAGSASKSVQAAREAKAAAEAATEQMERQLRQAESARTAAELAARREAELARQAGIRADSAAKDLQMAMEEAQVAQSAAEVAGKRAEAAERRAREVERDLEGLRLRAAEREEEGKGKVEGMVREIEDLRGEVGRRKEEVGETMAMLAVCEVEREGWRRKEGEARSEMVRLDGELERLRQVVEGMGVEMGVVRSEKEEMKGVVRVREEEVLRLRGMLEVAMRGNQERERERGRGEGRGGDGQGEGGEEMELEEGEEAGRKRKRARLGTGAAGEGGIAGEGVAAGEGGTGGEGGAGEAGLTGVGGTAGGVAGAGLEGAGDSAVTGDAAGTAGAAAGGEVGKRRGRGAGKRATAAVAAAAGASGAAVPTDSAADGEAGARGAPTPTASGNTGFESAQATGQGSEMDMDSASFGGVFGAGGVKGHTEGDEAESSKGGRGRGRPRRGGGGRRGRGRPAAGVGAVTAADVAGESDVAKRRREIAMKMTKSELKDRLTDEGRGLDVLEMRTPTKGQLVDLFVKFVRE
ncbi:unnamed protein product [Closterium sp. Naga37s-1]|nr:unnamed protein product [Closterium sp. Naga37s-1]